MALGAILAAALTDHTFRAYGLWIDGLDVTKEPATGTRRYGVDPETVQLRVAGPGAVSSLTFAVDDPSSLVTIADGQAVRFQDLSNDLPMFQGWVDHWSVEDFAGNQGRRITVTAVGAEALLDWCVTSTALTFSTATLLTAMIQAVVGSCGGLGELRALVDGSNSQGTQALPIGSMGNPLNVDATAAVVALTIPAGTPMRRAIELAIASCTAIPASFAGAYFTVDMTLGLRVWQAFMPPVSPDGDGSITSGPAGGDRFGGLAFDIDAGAIVRAVTVIGTGVTVTVGDGTGKRGPTRVLRDTTITTVATATAAGLAYLASFSASARGSLNLEDPATAYGALDVLRKLVLTDGPAGASGTYLVGGLTFRFYGLKRDMMVEFGGQAPSVANLARSLTRDQLS